MMRDEAQPVAVTSVDERIERLAESRRARGHSVHYGLQFDRRATDYSQNLCRRRLMLYGFGQRTLQVRIRCGWRSSLLGMHSRCPTARTELRICYRVLLLAPGTLHAALPRRGR